MEPPNAEEREYLDRVAISALSALIRNDPEINYQVAAVSAYDYADEMLKQRRVYDE